MDSTPVHPLTIFLRSLVVRKSSDADPVADFGQSYASKSLDKATEFYHSEIECVNAAATVARGLGAEGQWVLSVGATPTAHAATQIQDGNMDLQGELEL